MTNPAVIYLEPQCCADPAMGRGWCEHDAPVDCEDGNPWTKYVRADITERAKAERDALRGRIVGMEAQIDLLRAGIGAAKNITERAEAERDVWRSKAETRGREGAEARAERDALRALLVEARDEGIDDAWITFEEGQRWLRNVNAALAAKGE